MVRLFYIRSLLLALVIACRLLVCRLESRDSQQSRYLFVLEWTRRIYRV